MLLKEQKSKLVDEQADAEEQDDSQPKQAINDKSKKVKKNKKDLKDKKQKKVKKVEPESESEQIVEDN